MTGRSEGEASGSDMVATGVVKWFDSGRKFGFIVDDRGGPDILLHSNVLRDFGQSAVSEGSHVRATVVPTERGFQAVQVLEITPPPSEGQAAIPELANFTAEEIAALDLWPARVKWFDRHKGFGFANLFAQPGDVFLHAEVLRSCGFADLQSGEAVALRVISGSRGLMAAEVVPWDRATRTGSQGQPVFGNGATPDQG